jgi:hypothetical protein
MAVSFSQDLLSSVHYTLGVDGVGVCVGFGDGGFPSSHYVWSESSTTGGSRASDLARSGGIDCGCFWGFVVPRYIPVSLSCVAFIPLCVYVGMMLRR